MNELIASVNKIDNEYVFKVENTIGTYEIYYSTDKNMKDKKLFSISDKEIVNTKDLIQNERLFFEIINGDRTTGVFSTRLVDLFSIDNFRDLGGYKTKDGRSVKWGYFYRCANMGNVSESDKRYLENMGMSTIFDLRSKVEVESEPDVELKNCKYINESGIKDMESSLPNKENFDMMKVLQDMMKNPESLKGAEIFLINGYKTMAKKNDAFKVFFDNIRLEERLPLVFHCTAGKDRTGVAGALLLLALGVSE